MLLFTGQASFAESEWGIGGVVFLNSGNYVGKDDEVQVFPNISYRGDFVHFSAGEGLTFPLIENSNQSGGFNEFALQISPRMAPNFGDDPIFDGMKRDFSIDAGVKGQIGWAFLTLDYSAKFDALGVYDGFDAKIAPGVRTRIGSAGLGLSYGFHYQDEKLNRYLYGVYADEATSTRPSYAPESSLTNIISANAFVPINDRVSLIAVASYEDLSPLKPNPLLENYEKTSFMLGLNYKF